MSVLLKEGVRFANGLQRVQPRRSLGAQSKRAQQSSHLQSCTSSSTNRHPRRRDGKQRSRNGTKAALVLEKASSKMLVGGRGA